MSGPALWPSVNPVHRTRDRLACEDEFTAYKSARGAELNPSGPGYRGGMSGDKNPWRVRIIRGVIMAGIIIVKRTGNGSLDYPSGHLPAAPTHQWTLDRPASAQVAVSFPHAVRACAVNPCK